MSKTEHFRLRVYDNSRDTAYLELPPHPGLVPGCVTKTVMLHLLLEDYENYLGPALNLDFDHDGRPIGIEILYPSDDSNDTSDGRE